ncbi:MAG: DUF447 family protein [Nitrospinota bacterium]|nr:DUF447 family protein [Nitrospinota bacterium]
MIIETIVSTIGPDGKPNFAPMGVRIAKQGEWSLVVYHGSRTYQNLRASRSCVINLVSDVRLFVLTALYDHIPLHGKGENVAGAAMYEADEALEFEVRDTKEMEGKTWFIGQVTGRTVIKAPAAWYCRARGAVIEALIAVTRKGLLPDSRIEEELERSRIVVEKTGRPQELEAMELIDKYWSRHD